MSPAGNPNAGHPGAGTPNGHLRPGIRVQIVATLVAGLAAAAIVVRDGTSVWRGLRLVAVLAITAALLYLLRKGSRGPRSALAFAAGLAATATGLGIGPAHLSKAGWGLPSVAGLACLAAGLVLSVGGFAGLTRASGRWMRWATVPVLLVCAYVVLWSLGQAIAATNVPPTSLGTGTPAARGLSSTEVSFGTRDGVTLSAWYVPPGPSGATVVLLSGAGSTRSAVLPQAVVLARNGYGVLMVDARGHGRSGGRAMDFGWYGDLDVSAAVSYLASRPEANPDRIAALGLSMGGEEAIGAAAADARIRAVVAEGATNRTAADKRWMHEEFGLRGSLQEGIERLTYGAADLLTAAEPPRSLRSAARSAAPRPLLLVAAGRVPDEARADRFIAAASPATVTVWEVPGATHTSGLATSPAQWEQRVIGFLDHALGI